METSTILIALGLSLFAGLSTAIGGLIVCCAKKTSTKVMSFALGLSAGVMIYLSFVEMLNTAIIQLGEQFGQSKGYIYALLAFFGGILVTAVIDRLVPLKQNPHELRGVRHFNGCDENDVPRKDHKHLVRLGLLMVIVIGLHNFPEGFATFTASLKDISIGISIAIAIAIHNIPEGISIAMPIYCGTKNRRKAFLYSLIAGLAEPAGALIGFLVLAPFMSDTVLSLVFSAVAGIMVFISVDELLPAAQKYGHHHLSIYGLMLGMLVMAISLIGLA